MTIKARTAKPNIYQAVTDRILGSLKAGVIPWEKPWRSPQFAGDPIPRNFRTGKPYRGVNVFLLWATPYESPFWLTFRQAQELKGTVRKGEKGTQIVFYKQLRSCTKEESETEEQNRAPFVLCYYTVFNVELLIIERRGPAAMRSWISARSNSATPARMSYSNP